MDKNRKKYIDEQIAAGSTKTRAQLGREYDDRQARKTTTANNVDDLRKKVEQFIPAYSYLLTEESAFGPEVAQVLADAVRFDYTGPRLEGALRSTPYFRTANAATRQFDALPDPDKARLVDATKSNIAENFGDLMLDDATATVLATNIVRNGMNETAAKQYLYQYSFSKTSEDPSLGRMALRSDEAQRVRNLAKSYNYGISEDELRNVLTGGKDPLTGAVLSEDALVAKMKANIKGVMPQLADQIDSGLTLEQIGSNYKKYAAQVLEKDENSINMFDGPYLQAFGNRQNGQLSLSEWITALKTDSRFGWQYTQTANQQATDIALTLARAFGKVM
jgi:hypothetical protein